MTTTVNCPTCKKTVAWSKDNKYRPFCCKRCRLIDLGEWASEERRIPGDPITSDILSDKLKLH